MRSLPEHRLHEVPSGAGTSLHVRDFGSDEDYPVIFHHGTPSCSLALPGGWSPPPPGVRLITFDRPGYARSGNIPGRRVRDAADWTAAIADQLGLAEIAVMGTSGGGPHAAAAAAVLGTRVSASCIAVGAGPTGQPGFDPAHGMLAETRREIEQARAGESALRAFIAEIMATPDPLGDWYAQLPAADRSVLAQPDVQIEEEAESAEVEAAGEEGWIEDDLAFFARDWDVDLAATSAEVLIINGADDVLVPPSHGQAYRRAIGHGQVVLLPGAGHWLRRVEPAILRWLVERGRGPFDATI